MRGLIPPLPAKIRDQEELIRILDDRFRRIDETLGALNSGLTFDFGGRRLRNVGDPVSARDAVNLGYLQAALGRNRSTGAITPDASGGVTVGVTGSAIERVEIPLGADPNNISVSGATDGLVVVLFLTQDATGGRTVVWPTGWEGVAGLQPGPAAETWSVFLLAFFSPAVARLIAPPLLGVS
jgi:hypothetical protein